MKRTEENSTVCVSVCVRNYDSRAQHLNSCLYMNAVAYIWTFCIVLVCVFFLSPCLLSPLPLLLLFFRLFPHIVKLSGAQKWRTKQKTHCKIKHSRTHSNTMDEVVNDRKRRSQPNCKRNEKCCDNKMNIFVSKWESERERKKETNEKSSNRTVWMR